MEASSRLLAVSSAATMNPSASTPMCSFRQSRRFFDALCLCAFHSPQPRIFSPVEFDDQVDRAVVGSGQGRHRNDLVPARECGVVRGLEVEAHQAEQRVQEPLGLTERQAEDDPQRQRGPDREVRVPPLASAKTVLRWYPRGNCILAQPDRDVAAAPEATLVLPLVPDACVGLRPSCARSASRSITAKKAGRVPGSFTSRPEEIPAARIMAGRNRPRRPHRPRTYRKVMEPTHSRKTTGGRLETLRTVWETMSARKPARPSASNL